MRPWRCSPRRGPFQYYAGAVSTFGGHRTWIASSTFDRYLNLL
jgi:hypothetical protein